MGFSENIVVAETSFQMIEVLSFCNWEMVDLPSIKIAVLTFLVKKKKTLSGVAVFFWRIQDSRVVLEVVVLA